MQTVSEGYNPGNLLPQIRVEYAEDSSMETSSEFSSKGQMVSFTLIG